MKLSLVFVAALSLVACDACTKPEAKAVVGAAGTIALDTCQDLPATPVVEVVCDVIQGGVAVAKVVLSKRQHLALRAASVDAGPGGL